MLTIQSVMKEISKNHSKYFYEHISGYEVMYTTENLWRIRKIKPDGKYGGIWIPFTEENIIDLFNKYQINLYNFQMLLQQNLLTSAVYYKMQYDNVVKIMTKERVDQAVKDMADFGKSLSKVITKTFKRKDIKLLD